MSYLHRLVWIDAQIRYLKYPNCRTIAERFEISNRQASRDIEYLRYSMGAPIEYSEKHKGYFYSDTTYALPSFMLTDKEKETLGLLEYQYRNLGTAQAVRLAEVFSRLTAGSKPSDSIIYKKSPIKTASDTNEPVKADRHPEQNETPSANIPFLFPAGAGSWNTLQKAIGTGQKIKMKYKNTKSEISDRTFCPYKIFRRNTVSYVVGYCELRREVRVFRIDRIQSADILAETYTLADSYDPEDYKDDMPFELRDPYKAIVEFEKPPQNDTFALSIIHIEQNTYGISFFNSSEIIRALLSQPSSFSIKSPKWLRERLQKRLSALLEMNKK